MPGSAGESLAQARAAGADVRVVYSVRDALAIAAGEPGRQVVFFAIGFETTTPPTADAVLEASRRGLSNFSVYSNHVLTPAAVAALLAPDPAGGRPPVALDGLIGPAHVSTVIGSRPYEAAAETYGAPVVIAGFEPLDVLLAVLMLVRQVNDGRAEVENEYTRAVTRDGNRTAQALVAEVFETRASFSWRGLGRVPWSGLRPRATYAAFDAERRFEVPDVEVPDPPACRCGDILRGLATPIECPVYGTACTPESPVGACMVSPEGACAAYWRYGSRRRQAPVGG